MKKIFLSVEALGVLSGSALASQRSYDLRDVVPYDKADLHTDKTDVCMGRARQFADKDCIKVLKARNLDDERNFVNADKFDHRHHGFTSIR